MVPNTQNPSAQEVQEVHELDANSSAKGPSTPRAFTNYSSSWISSSPATTTMTISSPSLIPSPAAAATAQNQQLQPLDVTHSVISNFTETDASFVGYTTPAGATEGVLSVPSPSPSVSKPQAGPEPDSEPEAESKSGATPVGKTTAQENTVMAILITPRAHDADFTQREKKEGEEKEEKEAEEAAKKSKIRKQTAASYSVCAKWLREQMEDSG